MFSVSSNNYVKPLNVIKLPHFTIIYNLLVNFFSTASSTFMTEYDSLVTSNIKMKSHKMNNPAFVLGIPEDMMNMRGHLIAAGMDSKRIKYLITRQPDRFIVE